MAVVCLLSASAYGSLPSCDDQLALAREGSGRCLKANWSPNDKWWFITLKCSKYVIPLLYDEVKFNTAGQVEDLSEGSRSIEKEIFVQVDPQSVDSIFSISTTIEQVVAIRRDFPDYPMIKNKCIEEFYNLKGHPQVELSKIGEQ